MDNNAVFGFTFQSLICNKYKIIPESQKAINNFKSSFDYNVANQLESFVDEIFGFLKLCPIECTTFKKNNKGKEVPYNFILSDNSTLSIRTNFSSGMVAPRTVGQAGFKVLNEYFGHIYKKEITNKDDIKKLIIEHIDKVLPIFFDFLFDADYIIWLFQDDTTFRYELIKGDSGVDIDFDKKNFSFTKNYEEWTESTTLKYKGKSIAEIQIHKNRTFKLRFKMKNVLPLLFSKEINNETLGITAEKTICDMFNLDYPKNFFKRYSVEMQYQLKDVMVHSFQYLPAPIKHCGSESGERGGFSKSSYDFILNGNKTLSLKTNIGKKVCPPEVGQPNDKTCYLYFKEYVDDDHIDRINFKKMVFNHIEKLIPIYLSHMFDSDFLLRIYENNKKDFILTGQLYDCDIVEKSFGKDFIWKKELFSFSQPNIDLWNESNSVSYDGVSLGEFQVHNNRNCFKFRFNFDNLLKILRK